MEKRMSKKASTWSPAVDHGWDSTLNLSPSTCCLFSSLKSEFQLIMHQIVSVRTVALFWVEKEGSVMQHGGGRWAKVQRLLFIFLHLGFACLGTCWHFLLWEACCLCIPADQYFWSCPRVLCVRLRLMCAGPLAKASWLSPCSVKSCVHPWFPMHHEAEIKCHGFLQGIQYYRESLGDLCIYIVWWCIDNDVSAMIV